MRDWCMESQQKELKAIMTSYNYYAQLIAHRSDQHCLYKAALTIVDEVEVF